MACTCQDSWPRREGSHYLYYTTFTEHLLVANIMLLGRFGEGDRVQLNLESEPIGSKPHVCVPQALPPWPVALQRRQRFEVPVA
jgi:hypothetical protein